MRRFPALPLIYYIDSLIAYLVPPPPDILAVSENEVVTLGREPKARHLAYSAREMIAGLP